MHWSCVFHSPSHLHFRTRKHVHTHIQTHTHTQTLTTHAHTNTHHSRTHKHSPQTHGTHTTLLHSNEVVKLWLEKSWQRDDLQFHVAENHMDLLISVIVPVVLLHLWFYMKIDVIFKKILFELMFIVVFLLWSVKIF